MTVKHTNDRWQALGILIDVLTKHVPLSHAMLAHTGENSSAQSISSFTKELCFGVCRYLYRLMIIADTLVEKRPKDPHVWIALLMGLYQLQYMHVPDYAVVQTSVELLNQCKKSWAKGLLNAVLRRYCRERELLSSSFDQHEGYQHNHPDWLVQRIRNNWPNHWQTILSANDARPPMSLRVNKQKTTQKNYAAQLEHAGIAVVTSTLTPHGLTLQEALPVHELPGFNNGLVSVQDIAAQLSASLLDLQPKQSFLDACCAPGGKLCHALETEPALTLAIGLDVDAKRLIRVRENMSRLGLHATVQEGNASNPDHCLGDYRFDRILLDAPCSATGVIRRHPDIKYLRTPEDITSIVKTQSELLEQLWPRLKPHGKLVYATCSVLAEENDKQIAEFLKHHTNAIALPISETWGHATPHGRQILPGDDGMDGFFYAVLVKKERNE